MPRSRRLLPAGLATVCLLTAAVAITAAPARADGPTTFTNGTAISVPAGGSSDQSGPASPYPAAITVAGLAGSVSTVTAQLSQVTHGSAGDVDVLLVAPDGSNLVLMSDAGDAVSFTTASNATLTFSDGAAGSLPASGSIPTGTYKPSDTDVGGAPDTFPSPAPAPSADTTFAGAFTGTSPNGQWALYVVDDSTGDVGAVSGGWSLTVTTTTAAAATTTTVSSTPNPSQTGAPVTLEAHVQSSGSAVTAGSVSFTDNGAALGSAPLDGTGSASITTNALAEGSHEIVATYGGTADFLTSNGSTTQVVDSPTQVTNGRRFCNEGGLAIPDSGKATPYASRVTVTGVQGTLLAPKVLLSGLAHTVPVDLDIMLVAPDGQGVELMSDVGGISAISDVNLVFEDGNPPIATLASSSTGRYAPTNNSDDGPDAFPAPAPAPSASTLAALSASTANGVWSLYVHDDATGDAGSLGSWCLRLDSVQDTTTGLTVVPVSSPIGSDQLLTATVTSSGSPVSTGQVTFYDKLDGTRTLLGSVPLDADGVVSLTTSGLPVGRHYVSAHFRGTKSLAPSSSPYTALRVRPIAQANGPYTVPEGGSLSLSATGSTLDGTSVVGWDLNGDGDFSDATGESPTLTWPELQALGLVPGTRYRVEVRVTTNGVSAVDGGTLKVTGP